MKQDFTLLERMANEAYNQEPIKESKDEIIRKEWERKVVRASPDELKIAAINYGVFASKQKKAS